MYVLIIKSRNCTGASETIIDKENFSWKDFIAGFPWNNQKTKREARVPREPALAAEERL